MHFPGPDQADFGDVQAINREFLRRVRAPSGAALRRSASPALQSMITGLTDAQIVRLAGAPFLLLSVRERDDSFWAGLAGDESGHDLFAAPDSPATSGQLAAASLAFLWQLSRRNPYAARLISGATLSWCEQIADCNLTDLIRRMAGRDDLLRMRRASDTNFWHKLLGPGLSSESEVRHAAQLSALQMILTEDPLTRYRPLRAAACNTPLPSRNIATAQRQS